MATHLEIRDIREKLGGKIVNEKVRKKSGKFMENVKFRGKLNSFANVLENVSIALFILKSKEFSM